MFGLGHIVIMIFTVIFSFYTNSFYSSSEKRTRPLQYTRLRKTRTVSANDLGKLPQLFHCADHWFNYRVVLSKLAFLVLRRLISVGNEFVFQLLPESLGFVSLLFLGIFFLLLLINCWQIKKTNPISLLHGSKKENRNQKHVGSSLFWVWSF